MDSITPYTMALIAKYIARHRLRETRLLDTIAEFLVKKAEYLDSKVRPVWWSRDLESGAQDCRCVCVCPQVIQKLVFPFSRMSYRPSNEQQFFSRLEEVVELKALSSPLATVNILMSLFQLGHFPGLVLHRVFSSAFISNVTSEYGQHEPNFPTDRSGWEYLKSYYSDNTFPKSNAACYLVSSRITAFVILLVTLL